eukprot:COSAG01_NODE_10_length_42970_cov_93.010007_26_plen_51_part_00
MAVVEALVRTLMAQLFPLEHTLRRLGLSWEQCVAAPNHPLAQTPRGRLPV